jgi:DNA polymerase III gamma/tau subunit
MSLYHTYRPNDFDQIKGNEDVVESIEGLLKKKKRPHVYMLYGDYGCGKTTVGRIIANRIGCVGNDFKELNSASFRGIETARDIINQSNYKPLEGVCTVWLLDEIHKWTSDAQNALLKILEDTPPHIYFILCTTEPQKVIPTIHSRCSKFQLNTLTDGQMKSLLKGIVKAEEETLSTEVYEQIIQDSLGHPRDAIQILEQVLGVSKEKRLKVAEQTAARQSQTIELCRVLLNPRSRWKEVISILNGLKDQEPEKIRRAILGYNQSVLLKSDNVRSGLIMECFMEPNFTNGFSQLVFSAYQVIKNK